MNQITAILINPDQSTGTITFEPHLETIQALVGGYIELIRTDHGALLIQEEGRLHGATANPLASFLASGPRRIVPLVGPALLVGYPDNCEFASAHPADVATLREISTLLAAA